ncbi:MAG: Xaa-Pro peptidase family protein [Planctomycetes bacterium]|nr:Xaa-Pro peptidase family protein [Planctomycetota bacterium]
MPNPIVDIEACRGRQQRLWNTIEPLGVDCALLSRRESVQWLTGAFVQSPFEPLAVLAADGHMMLILPERQLGETFAVDELLGYEAKWHSTTRYDQHAASSVVLQSRIKTTPKRIACEFSSFGPYHLLAWNTAMVDIDSIVAELRRCKDSDELALMRRANEANQAMYERARQIVEPGVNELDVYSELVAVAVRTLGEPPTYFGQDFRSASRGGAPRDRVVQAGELFILDLGVGFRGYHSDNARTIAVDHQPSSAQQHAWAACTAVFQLVERTVQAGISCRQVFHEANEQLNRHQPWVFDHHLGHGVGLAPQEGPHINPRWNDTFAEGDFIAVEPGLYHEELRSGIRIEQNYLVTTDGVELLSDWPLGL